MNPMIARSAALSGLVLALACALPLAVQAQGDHPRYRADEAGHSIRPSQGQVERLIEDWPQVSRTAARQMIEAYGPPDGATPNLLVWHENGPWHRTVVSNEPIEHRFPMPHQDVLAQTVFLAVPIERFDDLARFDGSLSIDRTRGTITAHCDNQAANFLALNLAHDIIEGERDVADARAYYAESMQRWMELDDKVPYLQSLHFRPASPAVAGDPDQVFDRIARRFD